MAPDKKQYLRPELVQYGDIRELTTATGDVGKNDGGKTSPTKT